MLAALRRSAATQVLQRPPRPWTIPVLSRTKVRTLYGVFANGCPILIDPGSIQSRRNARTFLFHTRDTREKPMAELRAAGTIKRLFTHLLQGEPLEQALVDTGCRRRYACYLVELARSLLTEGMTWDATDPIAICIGPDGALYQRGGGTHRLQTAVMLGIREVPVAIAAVHIERARQWIKQGNGTVAERLLTGMGADGLQLGAPDWQPVPPLWPGPPENDPRTLQIEEGAWMDADEQQQLQQIADGTRSRTQRLAAQALLRLTEGQDAVAVARSLRLHPVVISQYRKRFLRLGLDMKPFATP